MLSVESILEILRSNEAIAMPISLIISIFISLSGIIPSVFVTGANIIFFGTYKGFLISLLGETIGGYITFLVYRFGMKNKLKNLLNKNKLISDIVCSEGRKAGILIFQGRLIPFIPSGAVTLAASVGNVDSKTFVLASFLGKMPSIALEALVSYDFINIYENWIRLGMTILALILLKVTVFRAENLSN